MTPVRFRLPALVAVAVCVLAFGPAKAEPRVTIDVWQADIHNVLRLIADAGGMNIVVPAEVSGKVTLKLKNVPWPQALETVLASRQLGQVRHGNVIFVDTHARLAESDRASLEARPAHTLSTELVTRVIPVHYARAKDLLPLVRALLSARGTVLADERANVLVVTDGLEVLPKVLAQVGGR